MSRRTQTTFIFHTANAAELFEWWLRRNVNDFDYGSPLFVDRREVGGGEWCVEYSSETASATDPHRRDFARGVAVGIELCHGSPRSRVEAAREQ